MCCPIKIVYANELVNSRTDFYAWWFLKGMEYCLDNVKHKLYSLNILILEVLYK